MTKEVIRDIISKPLGELKIVLFLCMENRLRVSSDFSLQYFSIPSLFFADYLDYYYLPHSRFTKHSLRS